MDCWRGRVIARTILEIPEHKSSIAWASSILPRKVASRWWRTIAPATMPDSRKIRPVQSGADGHCALLMALLLLFFRPGLPGRLTVILAGVRNRRVTVRQQPRIGPHLSSIRTRAHPPKGGSELLTGRFASGRATGDNKADGGLCGIFPHTEVVRDGTLTSWSGARNRAGASGETRPPLPNRCRSVVRPLVNEPTIDARENWSLQCSRNLEQGGPLKERTIAAKGGESL